MNEHGVKMNTGSALDEMRLCSAARRASLSTTRVCKCMFHVYKSMAHQPREIKEQTLEREI